jgi:formylglycine-generating enzyme required for sulfatase activity
VKRESLVILVIVAVMTVSCTGERVIENSLAEPRLRPSDGMTMLYVRGGSFMMGSTLDEVDQAIELCREHYSICNRWYYLRENPQHAVTLDGFWLDQTEVSNAQYQRCVEADICEQPFTCKKGQPTFGDPAKSDQPVVCVSWHDANAYCQWVGASLPSEAQWEYAYRGEAGSIFPWGDAFEGDKLNYCDINCAESHADSRNDDGYAMSSPVDAFPTDSSWAGVQGMSGNVSEWVGDWLGDYSSQADTNPSGPETGSEKMVKGCSWFFHPTYCRGAVRASISPDTRFDFVGFRCAANLEE